MGKKFMHVCIYACIYIFIHIHRWIKRIVSQTFEIIFSLRSAHMLRYIHTLRQVELKLSFKRVYFKKNKTFQGPGISIIIHNKRFELALKKNLFLICRAARLQVSCVHLNELMSEKLKKTTFNYLYVPCSGCSSRVWRFNGATLYKSFCLYSKDAEYIMPLFFR